MHFLAGTKQKKSAICITTGLLERLDYYEAEGVLAHELSHIKNNTTLLSTIITVMVGLIVILSDLFDRYIAKRKAKNKKIDSNSITMLVGLIINVLAPIVAKIMEFILPKKNKFIADKMAVKITQNPNSLKNALLTLENDSTPMEFFSNASSHMYIVDSFKPITGIENRALLSTHPSIEKRIEALEKLKIQ